jgi:hypothetical protein
LITPRLLAVEAQRPHPGSGAERVREVAVYLVIDREGSHARLRLSDLSDQLVGTVNLIDHLDG